MKSAEDIRKFFQKSKLSTNPERHEAIFEKIQRAQDQSKTTAPASYRLNLRRIIMKSPITKLAAAAVIIVAALLGVTHFGDSATSVVWAEVARKVQASRGVIFRSTEEIVPDTYGRGVDFSMNYYSSTQSRIDGYKGGQILKTIYSDCNTKTVILVDHLPSHKSYVKMTLEEMMPDDFRIADPNRMVQGFLSHEYRELGPKTIDGMLCEGFETTDPDFYGDGKLPEPLMARVWISVETGYPVQFEGEYVGGNDQTHYSFIRDQFQWDVELDEVIFEPNFPVDYIDISPY
jgi:hypothetical protein